MGRKVNVLFLVKGGHSYFGKGARLRSRWESAARQGRPNDPFKPRQDLRFLRFRHVLIEPLPFAACRKVLDGVYVNVRVGGRMEWHFQKRQKMVFLVVEIKEVQPLEVIAHSVWKRVGVIKTARGLESREPLNDNVAGTGQHHRFAVHV